MGVMTDTSEFSYLPAHAESLGVPLPAVERLTLPLPDGRVLSALRYGTGAPEITLLHGAGLNAHTWDATALLLQRPALAIDLAGHGDSSWRDDTDYSPRRLAVDVIAALEAWTTAPQVLVGQSLGGMTAAAVASTRPDLIDRVVIVDITPGIDLGAGPSALREFYAGATDFVDRDALVDRAIAFGFGGDREETARGVFLNTRVRPDGRVEWKHHFAHLAAQTLAVQDADAPAARAARAARTDSDWQDVVGIVAPITLVRATLGYVSETNVAEFRHRAPTAEVLTLVASHNVQETAPAELAAVIRSDSSPAAM